jgi:Flp pilus assembly protein TadG
MRLPRPANTRRSAAAAAELAFFMPVLAIIVLGCIDFGRFAYSYIELTNATRSGAFYAVMNPYKTSTEATWLSNILSNANQDMPGGTGLTIDQTTLAKSTDANGNTIYSNSDIIVTIDKTTGERRVSVTAHYPFKTVIIYPGMPSSLTMQRLVVMRSIR